MARTREGSGSQGRCLELLVLGGTGFLGPHVVDAARARRHSVTLFHRGRTGAELFPELERLRGDRDPDVGEGLRALEGRRWDGVIDTSGYVPRIVGASARLLARSVGHYVFVSTVSVYAGLSEPGIDESAPVATVEDPAVETIDGGRYGPLKALCEREVEAALPGRTTVLRPGLIAGPRDGTDRFTYWPVRVSRGGEVLSPGSPEDPVQYVDARDVADFAVHAIEAGAAGVFNVVGPRTPLTIAELLHGCRSATAARADFTWVPAAFLEAQGVAPWRDMPAWVPGEGETAGLARVSNTRAVRAGLRFRPLAATVRDTLCWFRSLPADRRAALRAGLDPAREAATLAAWHHHRGLTPWDRGEGGGGAG